MKLLTQITRRSRDYLWSADIGAPSALHRQLVFTQRTMYAVGRNLGEGRPRRTMSLHSL